jgi:PAS domain S-box-containing protein
MIEKKMNFAFKINELKFFFNNFNEPVLIIDKEFKIIFINSPAENLTGYKSNKISGKHISFLIEFNSATDFENIYLLKDINLKKNDGLILQLSISTMKSEFDDLVILKINQIDKEAEISSNEHLIEALERSYDFLESVMDNANPIIVIDSSGDIILINDSLLLLSGYLTYEIIGKKIFDIIVNDALNESRKNKEDLSDFINNIKNIEAELIKKNGEKAIIELKFNPLVNDGSIVSIVCSINDITEKKKDELKINKLLLAIENSPATVVITDASGKIEYVNPKFSKLTGYTFEETIGKNPSILKSGMQDKDFYKNLWDTILSGDEWRGEFHNKKKDGLLYWEFASISPIKNDNNEITNFIAVKEDITERKIYEENLKKSEEKLRLKNESMQQDLDYAQMIIKDILPAEPPKWERLNVEYRYISLDAVGGDFFWFYNLSDGTPAVYLGDVSGHGVSAALFLAMVKNISDGLLQKYGYNPGKYINALNHDLYKNMFSYFLTALYGVFDFSSIETRFIFSKGGHQPPIIFRKNENKIFSVASKGKPIALFENNYFDEISVSLNKGDRIFLYTDGLVESTNKSMEMLNLDGLEKIIMSNYYIDLNKSLEYILKEVNNFMGEEKAQDDIILIGIEVA